jgi:hypothetical protein
LVVISGAVFAVDKGRGGRQLTAGPLLHLMFGGKATLPTRLGVCLGIWVAWYSSSPFTSSARMNYGYRLRGGFSEQGRRLSAFHPRVHITEWELWHDVWNVGVMVRFSTLFFVTLSWL